MEIKFRDGWIHHPDGQFAVGHPVVDARQIDDRIIVLFDYMAFPGGEPARNLFAYTLDGNVLWRADDIGCGTLDAYTNIISTMPLVVGNFAGFVCSVDVSSGKVQATCFTK